MYYGGYGYGMDWTWILIIIASIFTIYAQAKVSSAYKTYSGDEAASRMTGADTARTIMRANGIDLPIEVIAGTLTDHYDPSAKVLRLSSAVANGTSVASVAIAAHEVGHAIQHDTGYAPIKIRGAIVPVVNLASKLAMPLIIIGILITATGQLSGSTMILDIGITMFAAVVAFHVITLPVELDASRRALKQIETLDIVTEEEKKGAKKVLKAAAMTYVAAMAVALLQLVRILAIRGRSS